MCNYKSIIVFVFLIGFAIFAGYKVFYHHGVHYEVKQSLSYDYNKTPHVSTSVLANNGKVMWVRIDKYNSVNDSIHVVRYEQANKVKEELDDFNN